MKSTGGPGIQSGAPSRAKVDGEKCHRPGPQGGKLPGMHRVADDPRHGAAVPEHRPEVEQSAPDVGMVRGNVWGMIVSAMTNATAAAAAPNRNAACGPARASKKPGDSERHSAGNADPGGMP